MAEDAYVEIPRVPVLSGPMPETPAWEAELPDTPVFYVSGTWIPIFPEEIEANFGDGAEGTLSFVVSGSRIPVDVAFGGSGTLSTVIRPIVPLTAAFTATGALTAVRVEVEGTAAPFTASGVFAATVVEVEKAVAAFVASGQLSATSIEVEGTAAPFTASGTLAATVFPRFVRTAGFNASGTLVGATTAIAPAAANFTASGVITTEIDRIGGGTPVDANFTGSGALSATVVEAEGVLAAFTGAGSLSATVVEREAIAPAFTGAGALTAATVEVEFVTAAFSATGDIATQTVEGEKIAIGFNSQASLSATVTTREYRDATFTGAGTLSAAVVPRFARTADFTGTGTLSAAVVATKLKAMRVNKNGTGQNGTLSTWTRVTGVVVDSAFTNSIVNGNGMQIEGTGAAKVAASIGYGYEYGIHQARIVNQSGTVLATSAQNNYPSVGSGNANKLVNIPPTSVTVNNGDILYLEFYTDTSFSGADGITTGDVTGLEVWPTAAPAPQGVIKTASGPGLSRAVWTLLSTLAADPARPGTTATTNGVTIDVAGTVYVHAYARLDSTNTTDALMQVYKNGAAVGTQYNNTGGMTAQFGGTQTFTVAVGDLIQIYGYSNALTSNRREFSGDGTKAHTWFDVVPLVTP